VHKEGEGAIKWTRLSCRSFAGNVVRLQLHALAYNLGNFVWTLAMPKTAEPWSLTSLREKLIKIGDKVINHSRYVTFQLAEVAVAADVRGYPGAHRPAAGASRAGVTGRWGQIRQTTTGEVRLDERKATGCSLTRRATRRFGCKRGAAAIEFRCAPP
jgi:hypothetical protein